MAQRRFRNSQRPSRGRKAAAINNLHEIKEVIQIQHAPPHRPTHRMLSSNFGDFSADSPAAISAVARSTSRLKHCDGASGNLTEAHMERRQFLRSTVLGATATVLGIAPRAAAATHLSLLQEHVMSDPNRPYEPLTADNAALVLVDHQVGLMTGVRDYSTGELKHNVVALAKAAKALKLPIIVTTTARDSMWGPTFPELVEALPGVP